MAQVQCINAKELLLPEIQKIVKDPYNPDLDTIIWQQMTLEYFSRFLHNKALYFKQLPQYSEDEERKLDFYKDSFISDDDYENIKNIKAKRYTDFEKIVYVSCWYNDEYIGILANKEYAGDLGVAIGISVNKILNIISNHMKRHTVEKLFT